MNYWLLNTFDPQNSAKIWRKIWYKKADRAVYNGPFKID